METLKQTKTSRMDENRPIALKNRNFDRKMRNRVWKKQRIKSRTALTVLRKENMGDREDKTPNFVFL